MEVEDDLALAELRTALLSLDVLVLQSAPESLVHDPFARDLALAILGISREGSGVVPNRLVGVFLDVGRLFAGFL